MEDIKEIFDRCPNCGSPFNVTRKVLWEEKVFDHAASGHYFYRKFSNISKTYKCTGCDYRNSIIALETSGPFCED